MEILLALLVFAYIVLSYFGIRDLREWTKECEYYQYSCYEPSLPFVGGVWIVVSLLMLLLLAINCV